jgi:hypothetical protein
MQILANHPDTAREYMQILANHPDTAASGDPQKRAQGTTFYHIISEELNLIRKSRSNLKGH